MSETLTYHHPVQRSASMTGRRGILFRSIGPIVWGTLALVGTGIGAGILAAILGGGGGLALAGVPWLWMVGFAIITILFARAMRGLRRARGLTILSWLDAAVRLNLPLHSFLRAAAAGEGRMMRRRLLALAETLGRGTSVGMALDASVREVSPRTTTRLMVAENVGQLAPELRKLLERQDFRHAARSRDTTTLRGIYPVAVCLTAVFFTILFITFVMPKFREIFRDYKVPLPPLTEALVGISEYLGNQPFITIPLILLAVLIALIVVARALREIITPWWPRTMPAILIDFVVWHTPMARRLARDRALADVCEFLADALRAGMPFPHALADAKRIAMNRGFARRLARWQERCLAGQAPGDAARAAGIPRLVAGFLDIPPGQGAGAPDTFEFLGRYYRGRHTHLMGVIADMTEPLITLILAVIVGLIALSLFEPVVALINAVLRPDWGGGVL